MLNVLYIYKLISLEGPGIHHKYSHSKPGGDHYTNHKRQYQQPDKTDSPHIKPKWGKLGILIF